MSDSTPHSIAEQILDGVTLPDYPELADLARAYVGLEERYEQMRGFRDECERQYQAKLDEVNGLVEQYERVSAERDRYKRRLQRITDPDILRADGLLEQFEAQGDKVTALFAGYSAKCERFSLGTCDRSADDGRLCRICQFFTDLGYESFEVTNGGLRSWRPVPNPARSPDA